MKQHRVTYYQTPQLVSWRHYMGVTLALGCGSFLLASCQPSGAEQAAQMQPPTNTQPVVGASRAIDKQVLNASEGNFAHAMWVWDATVITTPDQQKKLFDFCAKKNINLLFVSMGSVFLEPEAAVKSRHQVKFEELGPFLRNAHSQNIKVHVLDGDPSFALTSKHAITLARLQRALDYNKTAPAEERLDGFQWDTEPYILDEFKSGQTGRIEVLKQYLDSAVQMRDAVKKATVATPFRFALGYAIPFWMDGAENNVVRDGVSKPATFQLMDILNDVPNSYVAIMAYRDSTGGSNGSIAVTEGEAKYATEHTPNVHVWIGQETLDVKGDPPSITFWQEGEGALNTAIGQLQKRYQTMPAVAGVAIHHWKSYEEISERPEVAPVIKAFKVTDPKPGVTARETLVQGTAPAQPGNKILVAVKPDGDIWYEQGESPIAPTGDWSATVRLGNDKTPAGKAFTIRITLKDEQDKALGQQEIEVTRQ